MNDVLTILLPILTIGLIVWFFLRSRQSKKSKKVKDTHLTRQERAVWAWAKVLSATRSATDLSDRTRVELQLEVHMPGTPPYPATTTWLIEPEGMQYIEEGKEVSLKVDPQGPEYVYPNGPWAKFVE